MKIAQDLQHLVVPIDALRPDPRNARKHNERNMRAIRTSLEMFGQRKPIVIDTDGVVIAGNGTLQAALSLGADRIAVVRFEGTPEEARSYALADNKTAELAEWDFPELALQLDELKGISPELFDASGFDLDEMSKIVADLGEPPPVGNVENEPPPPAPPTQPDSVLGGVYELGPHRLVCGDATDRAAWEALMCGDVAAMVFTSPPYNVGSNRVYVGGNASMTESKYVDSDDNMDAHAFLELLNGFTSEALAHAELLAVNVQMLGANKRQVIEWLNGWRERFADVAMWNKGSGTPAMEANVMNAAFEFVFLLASQDKPTRALRTAQFRGTVQNVYDATRGERNAFANVHAATFPVHLPRWAISSFLGARPRGIVADCFAGTGTTMMAAHAEGRPARLIELAPRYCDVIRKRWTRFAVENNLDPGSGALE